ncbi:uncharacterized protein LOC125656483 [Ostrea edulis]|uniref:uncharacterized protein LOC125656483 n=1 Tax=Ostrea edulis TaxID=37623 RepID=UPI0020959CE3|nr:uncharacterized protein LOC125656483 [Ostrea edulis]
MGVSKKAARRSRIKYHADQIETMEELFRKHQYPDSESIELLAEKVGVSTGRVTIWFQNRRAKSKRESKDTRTQLSTNTSDTSTACVASEKSPHVITHSPSEADVESRLQTEHHPPRNLNYLPNCTTTIPNDVHNSSSFSGVSSSLNPLMMSSPVYSNSSPQQHSVPEYTPPHPTQQHSVTEYTPPQPTQQHSVPEYTPPHPTQQHNVPEYAPPHPTQQYSVPEYTPPQPTQQHSVPEYTPPHPTQQHSVPEYTPPHPTQQHSVPEYTPPQPTQQYSVPEYTPPQPTFHPQYPTDYQQPYFRHFAPPKPLVPVSHLHESYTPGFQLMQL